LRVLKPFRAFGFWDLRGATLGRGTRGRARTDGRRRTDRTRNGQHANGHRTRDQGGRGDRTRDHDNGEQTGNPAAETRPLNDAREQPPPAQGRDRNRPPPPQSGRPRRHRPPPRRARHDPTCASGARARLGAVPQP